MYPKNMYNLLIITSKINFVIHNVLEKEFT